MSQVWGVKNNEKPWLEHDLYILKFPQQLEDFCMTWHCTHQGRWKMMKMSVAFCWKPAMGKYRGNPRYITWNKRKTTLSYYIGFLESITPMETGQLVKNPPVAFGCFVGRHGAQCCTLRWVGRLRGVMTWILGISVESESCWIPSFTMGYTTDINWFKNVYPRMGYTKKNCKVKMMICVSICCK